MSNPSLWFLAPDEHGDNKPEEINFSDIFNPETLPPLADGMDEEARARAQQERDEYERFWGRRPFLQWTYQLAKSKWKNPWGMLMINLTRMVAAVDPAVVTPQTSSTGYGSLNLFTVIYGASGAGKSTAVDVSAEYLMVQDPADIRPLPTGEGLLAIYGMHGDENVRRALVLVDEAGVMVEAVKRPGSTLMGILREMWAGVDTGTQTAEAARRRKLPRHSYRLCFILGMQEKLSYFLLNTTQTNLGTPQRFIWARIIDESLTRESMQDAPEAPEPLLWEVPSWAVRPDRVEIGLTRRFPRTPEETLTPMAYDPDVRDLIDDLLMNQQLSAREADSDGLDSHAIYMSCKLACAMALSEGRREVNMQDWELARFILHTSVRNRAALQKDAKQIDEADRSRQRYAEVADAKERERLAEEMDEEAGEKLFAYWLKHYPYNGWMPRTQIRRLSHRWGAEAINHAFRLADAHEDVEKEQRRFDERRSSAMCYRFALRAENE